MSWRTRRHVSTGGDGSSEAVFATSPEASAQITLLPTVLLVGGDAAHATHGTPRVLAAPSLAGRDARDGGGTAKNTVRLYNAAQGHAASAASSPQDRGPPVVSGEGERL